MTDDRLDHLRHIGPLLWPAPLEMSIGRDIRGSPTEEDHREYLLLPNIRAPRLLVPDRPRRAAAAAVRRYGMGRGGLARWRAHGLAAGLTLGIAHGVMRDRVRLSTSDRRTAPIDAIETHLSEILGIEVLLSMHLSAPRANRKPVLQVLDPAGRTVAYVKVGIDGLTRQLVRAETAALATVRAAGLRRTTTPEVLHSGPWHGLDLLVQSALPVARRRRRFTLERVLESQAERASIGRSRVGSLADSPYWASLTKRIETLPRSAAASDLSVLACRLTEELGDVVVEFGAWHGDWAPWNMAQVGDSLLVWDWERFGPSVPVGFDVLHWHLQSELVARLADPLQSAHRCLSEAASRLQPLGLSREQVRATAMSYLVELTTRYLADRQFEAGARLGDVWTWSLPAIAAALGSRPSP